jgi:hypothetical protein
MDTEKQIKSNMIKTLNSPFLFALFGATLNTAYPTSGAKPMKRNLGVLTANAALIGFRFIVVIEMKVIRPKNTVIPTNCAFHFSRPTYFMKPINPKEQTNNRETIVTNLSNGERAAEDKDKDINSPPQYGVNSLFIMV